MRHPKGARREWNAEIDANFCILSKIENTQEMNLQIFRDATTENDTTFFISVNFLPREPTILKQDLSNAPARIRSGTTEDGDIVSKEKVCYYHI